MNAKNIAVVFAPTIMRDLDIEREMTDMQARNDVVEFMIDHSEEIFAGGLPVGEKASMSEERN